MISVIVPIFKGKEYINSMIKQIEFARKKISESVELLLVNDNPDEWLDEYISKIIEIKVINTSVNRGIHGARVWGLEHAHGDKILFLDQDDVISPLYFLKQIENLNEYDGVVCQSKGVKNTIKKEDLWFDAYISKVNIIISPGQVLLKKNSIPDVWKQNIIKNNGADDWFLWICLLKEGGSLAICEECLFEHVMHRSNASLNDYKMFKSEREVFSVICRKKIISSDEQIVIQNTLFDIAEGRLALYEISKKKNEILNKWINIHKNKYGINDYMRSVNFLKIVIYGAGDIGKQFAEELDESIIKKIVFMDRRAKQLDDIMGHKVILPGEEIDDMDCIIVSVIKETETIVDELKGVYPNIRIMTLLQLLDEMT